jgi:hypothetical protein
MEGSRGSLYRPFRAWVRGGPLTQAVGLGYRIVAFQARETDGQGLSSCHPNHAPWGQHPARAGFHSGSTNSGRTASRIETWFESKLQLASAGGLNHAGFPNMERTAFRIELDAQHDPAPSGRPHDPGPVQRWLSGCPLLLPPKSLRLPETLHHLKDIRRCPGCWQGLERDIFDKNGPGVRSFRLTRVDDIQHDFRSVFG